MRSRTLLGHYFYGTVILARDAQLPIGSKVIGWCPYAHRDTVDAYPNFLRVVPDNVLAAPAVIKYAAITTATLLVHGVARVRSGDTVEVYTPGILGEALRLVCDKSNISVMSSNRFTSADFTISFDLKNGLSLNYASYLMRSSPSGMTGRSRFPLSPSKIIIKPSIKVLNLVILPL